MVNNSGVAATMFEALYDAHININMIATSEIKISFLLTEKMLKRLLLQFMINFVEIIKNK